MDFGLYSISAAAPLWRRSLSGCRAPGSDLILTKETVEVAIAAGEYESLLKKMMVIVNDSSKRHSISSERMGQVLNCATPEQIEKFILPVFLPFLEKTYDYLDGKIYEGMPIIFTKLSPEQLEKILPKLFKFLNQENTPSEREQLLLICIEKMNANVVEKIIVPGLFKLCEQAHPDTLLIKCIFDKLLLKCIEKIDAASLETAIVPQLLTFKLDVGTRILIGTLLLKCVDKMSTDAIQRSLQTDLEARFSHLESSRSKEEKNNYHEIDREIALAPYLALMSRFTKEENDKISEGLLKYVSVNLRDCIADTILTCLKELRRKNKYVNEIFFQAVHTLVHTRNEKYLKEHAYSRLLTLHMTLDQVTSLVENKNLASELKVDDYCGNRLDLKLFENFAALPMETYPMQLRMKSLRFIRAHLDHEYSISSLVTCLKTGHFSGAEFQNILIEFIDHALANIQSICHSDQQTSTAFLKKFNEGATLTMEDFTGKVESKIGKYHYCKLLEACTSIMTEEELIAYMLPKTRQMLKVGDNGKLNIVSIDTEILKSINECLKLVFLKINNNDICREFFNYFLNLYIKKDVCSDLLPILSDKVDLNTIAFAYRTVLQSDHSNYMVLGRHAYLLALLSKRIPNQANASHHAEIKEITERRETNKPERSCALM